MFKYYSIPDEKTLVNIIGEKPTIKFTSAFNLNDPFELKFNLHIDPDAKGQMEAFLQVHAGKTEKDFKEWQDSVRGNRGYVWYTEQTQRAIISQMVTMSSFTETNTNNLMWSHYTDNYKGICVEYVSDICNQLENTDDFFAHAPVIYSATPPLVDIVEPMDSRIMKMIFNKQKEWQYEREHRVVLMSKKDTDFVPIATSQIKAVYIGSKAMGKIEKKVIELCNDLSMECYSAIALGNTYEVQFKKHKEGTFFTRSFW